MGNTSNIPVTAIAWGFGFAVVLGFIVGLFMSDYGRCEYAKLVGKDQANEQ